MQGHDAYMQGDFDGAADYYQSALIDYENAWSNETEKIPGFEDAIKGLMDSGQNVLAMVGWGYTFFGLGFTLMGIGALVYLVSKSRTHRVPP